MAPPYLLKSAPWSSLACSPYQNCLVAAGPHHGSLRNFEFKVGVSVPKKANLETVLVLLLDIGRRHADEAVARVVVGVNQVLDDIHPTHGAAVLQICPYPGLDIPIKSLHQGRLLLAFTGKVLNTVAFHQSLKVRVEEFLALVGLSALRVAWVRSCEHLPESSRNCLGVFRVDRHRPGELKKYINHGKRVPHSAVLPGDTLHIGQVGLPLSIDPRHIGVVSDEPTARRLVQRIGLLAF